MSKTQTLVRPEYSTCTIELVDGQKTTVKYLEFDKSITRVGIVCFDELTRLEDYCQENDVEFAINGGFFGTEFNSAETGSQLGELWLEGKKISESSSIFDRGCVCLDSKGEVYIDKRSRFPKEIGGSLLEVGPLLVRGGKTMVNDKTIINDQVDREGFSAESMLFDGDLTKGRFPRSALAIGKDKIWAIVCEGRSGENVGVTLVELADNTLSLGAESAINLDGGSASSLVVNSKLVNNPRMGPDRGNKLFPHGRPIKTAIIFR